MEKIKHLEYKFSTLSYDLIKACDDYELRFYAWLKLWAINKSSAWPGIRTIAEELSWSHDKVQAAVKKMESKNRLLVLREDGRNNVYDITWYDEVNQNGLPHAKSVHPTRKISTPPSRLNHTQNRTQTNNKLLENNEADFQQAVEKNVENKKPVSQKTIMDIRNDLAKKGVPGFGR